MQKTFMVDNSGHVEIDFDGAARCRLRVYENAVVVEKAENGWGSPIEIKDEEEEA